MESVEEGDVDSESNVICRFTFGNSSASAMGLRPVNGVALLNNYLIKLGLGGGKYVKKP